jgi:hypothetical protein
MKKQEMMNLLFQMLGSKLADTDFRLKKSEAGFVRKIPGGWQMLGVPLWDYNPEFVFSLNICIRVDGAEEVFHQFSGSPAKYHSLSVTTITPLEYFTGGASEIHGDDCGRRGGCWQNSDRCTSREDRSVFQFSSRRQDFGRGGERRALWHRHHSESVGSDARDHSCSPGGKRGF